jgi:hypothetical protein
MRTVSRFATELRVSVGRFCQHNCFQEALLPVLEHEHGCDPAAFPLLRMVRWDEVADALKRNVSPGIFGGLQPDELAELYGIVWHTAPTECPVDELFERLALVGTPICKVDRFHVPADRRWFGRVHRPHSVLVVAIDEDGISYSDADYPDLPARIDWSDLERALLRDTEGELVFARAVARCTDIEAHLRRTQERRYLEGLAATLAASTATVRKVLRILVDRLVEFDPLAAGGEVAGVDAAAFLNALSQSLLAGAELVRQRDLGIAAADAIERLGRRLDVSVTRALTYAETRRPRHGERLAVSIEAIAKDWSADGRRRALAALQEANASPGPDRVSRREVAGALTSDPEMTTNQEG